MNQFNDKVVFITGGSMGIGRSCAIKFAQQGAKVIITSRRKEEAEEVVEEIIHSKGKCEYFQCDISKTDELIELFKKIGWKYKAIDISVNNAAISGQARTLLHEFPDDEWDKVINVNLTGMWSCMKHEIPLLLKNKGGVIVNVSSVGGLQAGKVSAAYTASKHGVIGLTKAAAVEYAPYGIRVNAVCPAFIKTPMISGDLSNLEDLAKTTIPLQRCGTPDEVADVILWLCSEQSSFINGVALPIDGGMMA